MIPTEPLIEPRNERRAFSFLSSLSQLRRPATLRDAEQLLVHFSAAERLLLYILSAALALSSLILLWQLNDMISVTVPTKGGSFSEAIVGPPRFVNPVLAISQTDTDVTKLVFSGLMRSTADGQLLPDLAESFTVSPDGTTYSFTLRENLTFHDGAELTADDVLYTIAMMKSPEIRSPRRADWEGVQATSSGRVITFTLPKPYAPFLENMTVGILPEHLWKEVTVSEFAFSPLNTEPIGSGPYQVTETLTEKTGAVTQYNLQPFSKFALGSPYIKNISLVFFADENAAAEAFLFRRVDVVSGVTPELLASSTRTDVRTLSTPLPRVFGIFFNDSHAPILTDIAVRKALNAAVDKDLLLATVLNGHGTVLDGPLVPEYAGGTEHVPETISPEDRLAAAKKILTDADWLFDEETHTWTKDKKTLSLSISTVDTPELRDSARFVADAWNTLGVQTDVHLYSLTELNTAVIRPREYDALLFGEVVGHTLDLYAFWHSKERQDPGLNLAQYANSKADTLLTSARTTDSRKEREALYRKFAEIVTEEVPAVFLFAPSFSYAILTDINGVTLGRIGDPSDRYLNVYDWYIDTERVWSVFASRDPLNYFTRLFTQ